MLRIIGTLIILAATALGSDAGAEGFRYSPTETVVGSVQKYIVKDDESLIEIARKFELGYNAIIEANPSLDAFVPGEGAAVTIPTSWVLPDVDGLDGILINLPELRLYYFYRQRGETFVETFPIGIGRQGFNTPLGTFKIIEKIVKPSWHVPESIKLEKPELPDVVPPGPDNPLGSHAMRLSDPTILMHGTNKPWGVGRLVSHGCIRLYPEDIPRLFAMAPIGLRVTIARQPIKVGVRDKKVYMEVHRDPYAPESTFLEAVDLLRRKGLLVQASISKVHETLEKREGVPVDVTEKE